MSDVCNIAGYDLDRIEEKIDNLTTAHNEMVEKVNATIGAIEPHLKEIAPLVDAIANNPMFKMFTGTKGKK